MKKIAVIDLGSNSVRMSIFDNAGKTLAAYRHTIRLSEGMTADMRLQAQPQMRAAMMLKQYRDIMDAEGICEYRAVATAAVRKAKNRREFLDLVRDVSGICVQVIDGQQEAMLDSLAVARHLNCKRGIICDIGGGSTELIGVSEGGAPMVSLPYGSRGICEMFFANGETAEAARKAQDFADSLISEAKWLDDFKGETLVGIGGTLRAMAKLHLSDFGHAAVESYELSPVQMAELIAKVENADIGMRADMPGIGAERADIILGGVILMKAVLAAAQPKRIAVADVGVREGVFYDITEKSGILK